MRNAYSILVGKPARKIAPGIPEVGGGIVLK
jgi:hypothetical protein